MPIRRTLVQCAMLASGASLAALALSAHGAQDRPAAKQPVQAGAQRGEPREPAAGDAGDERMRDMAGKRGRAMPTPPDWPRAGGFGPERNLTEGLAIETLVAGEFGRRELTDADLARAVAVAREVSPEWGDLIAQRAKDDPEQMKAALRTGARRLLALAALKERAPRVFNAKVAELRAQGDTMRAAAELRRLEGDGGAAPEAVAAARAALETSAAKQVEATIAARAEELSALEDHIGRMRQDLARDGNNVAELAKDVVKRARERERVGRRGGPDGRDEPDRGDGPGRADGPDRPDRPDRDDRGDRPDRPDAPPPPPRGDEPGPGRP